MRDDDGVRPLATLNGTRLAAITRTIVAPFGETAQQADGSVRIPAACVPTSAGTRGARPCRGLIDVHCVLGRRRGSSRRVLRRRGTPRARACAPR